MTAAAAGQVAANSESRGESLTRAERWDFQRRQGLIAEELIAVGRELGEEHPEATIIIVVGSSSLVTHRIVGSVAVSLARHSPVPLVVVP